MTPAVTPLHDAPAVREPTPFQIIVNMVMAEYDIRFTRLSGRAREAGVVLGRQAICWTAWRVTPLTCEEIGERLNRDRTTVENALWRANKRRAADPAFREFTDRLVAAVPDKAVPE